MNIRRSKKNNIPLCFQLEQIIKSKILIGEFLLGEQIPTEKDLCETYQLSTITARQAILNLVNEGLIIRRQGRGSFVRKGLKIFLLPSFILRPPSLQGRRSRLNLYRHFIGLINLDTRSN